MPPCVGVSCFSPEPNQCDTDGSLLVWSSPGWCEQGDCVYASHTEPCASGLCESGICSAEPCQGVTCASPPEARCADGAMLQTYQSNGKCEADTDGQPQCVYEDALLACASGCAAGQCLDNPCAGVVCRIPPARYCQGDTLIVYDTVGRCQGAAGCVYGAQPVTCGLGGCAGGRCVNGDPCEHLTCDTPPAHYCVGDALRTFSAQGACGQGQCLYEPEDLVCAQGCAQGACQGEPCAGVSCHAPPSAYCKNGSTLVFWNGQPGHCTGGVCTYGVAELTCEESCEAGACTEDPCAGVICARPPVVHCDGATLVRYAAVGECLLDGWCSYEEALEVCPSGCANSACLPETDTDTAGTGSDTADTGSDTPDTGSSTSDTGTGTIDTDQGQEIPQPGSSLIWLRCPLAQTWNGADCIGSVSTFDWNTALSACPSGYRLPTRQELIDLLGGCDNAVKSGNEGTCKPCRESIVCNAMFPEDENWYWSSTQFDATSAWYTAFYGGRVYRNPKTAQDYVRCVRLGP
jgi:hypothetical protein